MLPRLATVVLSALAVSVAAQNVAIFSPGKDVWWVAQSDNNLAWDCKANTKHATFTVLVANKDPKVLTAPLPILAVQQNFDCSKLITQNQLTAPPGTGYTVLFSSALNQTDVFATSDEFEIKPIGATYPTFTPGLNSASASGGSQTQTGPGAQNTNKPNAALSLLVTPGAVAGAVVGAAAVALFGL